MLTDQDKDALAVQPVPKHVVEKVFDLDRRYERLRVAALEALSDGALDEVQARLRRALQE